MIQQLWQQKTPDKLENEGLFHIPNENDQEFYARMEKLSAELSAIQDGSSDLMSFVQKGTPIPNKLRDAADKLTWEKYRFRAEWVPAWYSSEITGRLSAGITLVVDGILPMIFLHGSFMHRKRRMGYDAAETLAHELVHAARTAFPDSVYDEFFPCQIHQAKFRRYAGNVFRKWYLPMMLLGGIAAAPVLAAAGCSFWGVTLIAPLIVIAREFQLRRRIRNAADNLRNAGFDPMPVLLRMSDREIFETATLTREQLAAKKASSPRWQQFADCFPIRTEL